MDRYVGRLDRLTDRQTEAWMKSSTATFLMALIAGGHPTSLTARECGSFSEGRGCSAPAAPLYNQRTKLSTSNALTK